MLRRQARTRREFIYRKSIEQRERAIADRKERLKSAIEGNKELDGDLRKDAIELQKTLAWEDEGGQGITSQEDDEYRWAGVEDPKIVVTTSRDPSSKLKVFAKEFRLLLPNSQRINRGNYEVKQLMEACRANDVTDLIILKEHRGKPDGLLISHLPHGPTAYFTLYDVIMRHDLKREGRLGTMSEQYPHLVFHGLTSRLGQRVCNILKYLFPVPKEDSKRVLTFYNKEDFICFRHHVYKKIDGNVELSEVGPRFQMRLYKIVLSTLESVDSADVEFVMRPYMNTARKRRFLSKGELEQTD